MFEKLIEILVGAKSGALSGVLIVAGAVVTVSGGNGVTAVTIERPSPAPVVESSPEPAPSPLEDPEPSKPPRERDRTEKERAGTPSPESCAGEAHARAEARQKVQAAFAKFHAGLEQLREERRSATATLTLKKADAMLREIAEKADELLAEMAECEAQVAERAVAAMETVYNLAQSAAAARPTPKPTEKAKPRPSAKPKATPKPSRTPSCDDKIHANRKQMAASFERFHSANDKLLHEIKKLASERTIAAVKAADKLMHTTYDSSKNAILRAGCAEGTGATVAAVAADAFERAYLSAKAAVTAELASRR